MYVFVNWVGSMYNFDLDYDKKYDDDIQTQFCLDFDVTNDIQSLILQLLSLFLCFWTHCHNTKCNLIKWLGKLSKALALMSTRQRLNSIFSRIISFFHGASDKVFKVFLKVVRDQLLIETKISYLMEINLISIWEYINLWSHSIYSNTESREKSRSPSRVDEQNLNV